MAEAHYVCMILIGIGSFVFGVLPICFTSRAAKSHPFFLSLILCLGGGVLLATSIVHMLTEVQIKLKISAQLYFCVGFFILYIFDEISHYLFSIKQSENSSEEAETSVFNKFSVRKSNYGATNYSNVSEHSSLLESLDDISTMEQESLKVPYSKTQQLEQRSPFESIDDIKYVGKHSDMTYLEDKDNKPHSSHVEDIVCSSEVQQLSLSNTVAKTGLLIALVIHSVLEGLSIGVQTDVSQIYLILGAVAFHKIVLSFCLGLELLSYGFKTIYLLFSIFIFSAGSCVGIFMGMFITSFSSIFNIDDQLQAIAAGSLMYVAAFEVLPRERFRWQHKSNKRAAGLFQLFFVILGFGFMTALNLFVVPIHSHGSNTTENVENITFTEPPL